MKHMIVFPGYCKNCHREVSLDEVEHGRERLTDGERIFRVCPHCHLEIDDEIALMNEKTEVQKWKNIRK